MNTFEYFLFPHTVLAERDYRHLALLIPHLHVLQLSRQLLVPEWGSEFFSAKKTISEEQGNQVRILLKQYKSFADLVGNGTVLASLSYSSGETNWRESRFRIQSAIKGRSEQQDLSETEVATLEAALFLEMARDLDQQGMELENDVARARSLESEFRKIVGITSEDEWEEPLEIGDSPLAPEKGYLNFMLEKRMAFWLRLFSSERAQKFPVLVTVVPEVVEEIIDRLMSVAGSIVESSSEPVRIPLISIPSLNHLSNEQFLALIDNLKVAGTQQVYWQSLENVLQNPKDSTFVEEFNQSASQLQTQLADYCMGEEILKQGTADLTLTLIPNLSMKDLWRKLDKDGGKASKPGRAIQHPISIIACNSAS